MWLGRMEKEVIKIVASGVGVLIAGWFIIDLVLGAHYVAGGLISGATAAGVMLWVSSRS